MRGSYFFVVWAVLLILALAYLFSLHAMGLHGYRLVLGGLYALIALAQILLLVWARKHYVKEFYRKLHTSPNPGEQLELWTDLFVAKSGLTSRLDAAIANVAEIIMRWRALAREPYEPSLFEAMRELKHYLKDVPTSPRVSNDTMEKLCLILVSNESCFRRQDREELQELRFLIIDFIEQRRYLEACPALTAIAQRKAKTDSERMLQAKARHCLTVLTPYIQKSKDLLRPSSETTCLLKTPLRAVEEERDRMFLVRPSEEVKRN